MPMPAFYKGAIDQFETTEPHILDCLRTRRYWTSDYWQKQIDELQNIWLDASSLLCRLRLNRYARESAVEALFDASVYLNKYGHTHVGEARRWTNTIGPSRRTLISVKSSPNGLEQELTPIFGHVGWPVELGTSSLDSGAVSLDVTDPLNNYHGLGAVLALSRPVERV